MPRRGENIRKRKDGRWEGRYIQGYDFDTNKAKYVSLYGKSYQEVREKLNDARYGSGKGVSPPKRRFGSANWRRNGFPSNNPSSNQLL